MVNEGFNANVINNYTTIKIIIFILLNSLNKKAHNPYRSVKNPSHEQNPTPLTQVFPLNLDTISYFLSYKWPIIFWSVHSGVFLLEECGLNRLEKP
jgi:hypothetical protein